MNQQDLKKFVIENPNLVKMRQAGDGIYVLKYTKRVFYDSLWNDYIEECRGTIVDEDFNVISRPFTKIYNYGIEEKAPVLAGDIKVTAYRKVNGFMVAMTWYKDDILVSTTGSTDSSYVDFAKQIMKKEAAWDQWMYVTRLNMGATLMFECVHPEDPHIVPEEAGMYFLGWRMNSWESVVDGFGEDIAFRWKRFALQNGLKYAESFQCTLDELIEMTKTVKHEGFVFYAENGISSKIKSPYYLTSKWLARNPRTDKLMRPDFKKQIDEEYYPLLDAIRENITEYTAMDEQGRLAWVRNFLEK